MSTPTINTDLLEQLQSGAVQLDRGEHGSPEEGHCAMEVVSMLANEGFTDAPDCASRVLRSFTIGLNDQWDSETRQRLAPFLPRMIGTANDGKDEARSYMALDWLIRTYTPTWLDLAGLTDEAQELRSLRRIVDLVTAERAGDVARKVRDKAQERMGAAWDTARDAAWEASGVAARDSAWGAAWDTARDAAWEASRVAVRDAARVAVWVAAWDAAWDAARETAPDTAWAAFWVAAREAAEDALKTTVEALQDSALQLLDDMINPNVEAAA